MPVADAVGGIRIGNNVDCSGNCHNAAGFCSKRFGKGNGFVQIFLGDAVGNVGINAFGGAGADSKRFDFRNVSANNRKLYLLQQLECGLRAQRRCTCSHRV